MIAMIYNIRYPLICHGCSCGARRAAARTMAGTWPAVVNVYRDNGCRERERYIYICENMASLQQFCWQHNLLVHVWGNVWQRNVWCCGTSSTGKVQAQDVLVLLAPNAAAAKCLGRRRAPAVVSVVISRGTTCHHHIWYLLGNDYSHIFPIYSLWTMDQTIR